MKDEAFDGLSTEGRGMNFMKKRISLDDISIRNELIPGDLGNVIRMHGELYSREYGYGLQFEDYVAKGVCEFYENYDPKRDRVWVCEHDERIVGFLLLMHRSLAAQLRYFLIEPGYRGIGLGGKLIGMCMQFLRECGYKECYLWTTNELPAAAHLYKRVGFVLTEEKDTTNFGKPVTEQRYDLVLQ